MNGSGENKLFHTRLVRSLRFILLTCFLLAACSSLEAGRYKRQAEQFAEEGRLPEAVLTYRQALEKDPNNIELMSGLSNVLAAQGRSRSAQQVLQRANEIKPDDISIRNSLEGLNTQPQDGLSLKLTWITTVTNSEPIGATVASGRIFIAYAGGHLLAFDQATGQRMWETESPVAFVSPPTADADQVWVGAEDGSIFVYDAKSGQMLGKYLTEGAVYAAPSLTPDIAFCPSNDGTLYALNRTDLKVAWKAEVGAALHVSPLVSEQAVYVGSNNGRLYGFSRSSGERLWPYGILTQGAVESVPVLADGRIFFGSGDGRMYALDAETGGEYWRFSTPDAIYARPLTLNDQVIVASSGQVLASLQQSDGVPSWSLSFKGPITEAPVLFKDQLYVVARNDPRLFAVDPQTGKLLGELNTGDWIALGPFTAGTDLILVGKDGAVFLYR